MFFFMSLCFINSLYDKYCPKVKEHVLFLKGHEFLILAFNDKNMFHFVLNIFQFA